MGMPRALKDEFKRLFNSDPRSLSDRDFEHYESTLFSAGRLSEVISIREWLPQSIVDNPDQHRHVRLCMAKAVSKYLHRGSCVPMDYCSFDKVLADKYVGLEERGEHEFKASFVPFRISRGFISRLKTWNEIRENEDRRELEWRDRKLAYESRIYKQRTFPATLRQIIFQRDNFTCQNCGKPRSELIADGSRLEVDHKLAWEDGGETCYGNGLTLCRSCNVAKHYAKKHFKLSPPFHQSYTS